MSPSSFSHHRLARERQILAALGDGLRTIPDMVSRIYADVSPKLYKVAAMSVESHLTPARWP